MTHTVNRQAILDEQALGNCAGVRFHFYGAPFRYHPNRMLARCQSWLIFRKWQSQLLHFAAALHQKFSFDLTHHTTYVTWRVASPLWKLPIPFVWGPIGGTASIPHAFLGILSPTAILFESARHLSTLASSRMPAFLSCASNAAIVVAANEETEVFLRRFRPSGLISRLWPVFFTPQQVAAFRAPPRSTPQPGSPLRLFAGGNLEGRKGVALALKAIAEARRRGVQTTYVFGGWGPELSSLQQLARRLGLEGCVEFHQGFEREEYIRQLRESDVYFLPSFRETTPITLLEATLAGCYPIVADSSGAGEIVQRIGGTAVPAHDQKQIVSDLADVLQWCERNRSLIVSEAQKASAKTAKEFGKARYIQRINEIYQMAAARYDRVL